MRRSFHRFALHPFAVAAALATLAWPAAAQFVTLSGDVSPAFVPAANVDLTGARIFIGNTSSGVGSFGALSVTGGGSLTAAQIVPGVGGLGIGTVTVTGPGSIVNLTGGGPFNGLDIGSWGTGTMTVANGATVACSSPLACPFSSIGTAAGSTGLLTINGGVLSGFGSFAVGSGNLLADFGTAGAATSATLNIANNGASGGVLSTSGYNSVASNSGQTGLVTGTVSVSGAGSTWAISRDLGNGGGQAFLGVAPSVNGLATFTISNGGTLSVTGSRSNPATDNSLPGLNMSAAAGAASTMTVTTGGSVLIGGDTGVITLGGNSSTSSAGAEATLNVTNGGKVSGIGSKGLTFMAIGQNLGSGTVNVDGAGSQLTVAGVGGVNTQGLDGVGGLVVVGRNRNNGGGGVGALNVTDGGSVLISDDGQAASTGSMGLRLADGADSIGTANVSGASIVVSSTGGTATTPYVVVGQGGTGTMTVSNGGSVLVQGSGQRNFIVGNSSVGSGALDLNSGAQISASWFAVGNGTNGLATINNSTASLDGVVFFNGTSLGAGLRVGRGVGASGTLNLENGAAVNIDNSIPDASVILGGTGALAGGTGTVSMSGGSSIKFTGSAADAFIDIGGSPGGAGIMSMAGSSIVDVGAGGRLAVGGVAGSSGTLEVASGSKAMANAIDIGGNSDSAAGGTGAAAISGAGSELSAVGATGFIGVGRGGTGTLGIADQGQMTGIVLAIGRSGGNGTLVIDNATAALSGQQTAGQLRGARFTIGTGGGTGSAVLNNSSVSVSNAGSDGAGVSIGGSGSYPLGNGSLTMANSQIAVNAALGHGFVNIGGSGTGIATLSASSITNSGGDVFVAREAGSTGVLSLNNGSSISAGFVGVGVSAKYDGITQANGGTGVLVLNNSTITASGFELGAGSILTGDNGTIEIVPSSGDVVIGGTIAPGNSPGRLRIRCNIIMLGGSRIILEVSGSGDFYEYDELIIDSNSSFDLASAQIEFSFLGETNPEAFAAIGGMNLDNFFRSETGTTTSGLSTAFAPGQTWSTTVNTAAITAVSESPQYSDITLTYTGDGSIAVVAVPEPSTWGLMFFGLAAVAAFARRRSQRA